MIPLKSTSGCCCASSRQYSYFSSSLQKSTMDELIVRNSIVTSSPRFGVKSFTSGPATVRSLFVRRSRSPVSRLVTSSTASVRHCTAAHMFQFHSIPLLAHLRHRPYRDMASPSPDSPPALPTSPPQTPTPDHEPFPFLDLPLELREQVYSLYFRPADRLRKSPELESQGFYGGVYDFDLRLQRTCKQIAKESKRVWRREVRTVKIGTPWPSAGTLLFVQQVERS